MPDIALDKASFVSLFVESILYGTFTVLFGICIHILLYSRRSPGTTFNMPLLITAVLMFSMSTMHVAIDLVRGLDAFIGRKNTSDGALGYYAEIWLWISIFKQAIYVSNNIVADSLVIYRCYIVWGSNVKIIILPVILLLATSISGYIAVYNFSTIVPGEDVFATNIAEWAGRIYWIAGTTKRLLGRKHSHKYENAVAIILESGAIYSMSLMTLLITYCVKTNAQYIVYDAQAQVMGIVPTLIIVRVGLGVSTQDTAVTLQTGATSSNDARVVFNRAAHRPVRMQVHKVVHVEGGTVDSGSEDPEGTRKHFSLYPNHSSVDV